jgi:RNA polymerase sigma factor (sigma-70 family)
MSEKELDYNNIDTWRDNPDLIMRTARRYAYRWGQAYNDKEDLEGFIVEALLKVIKRYEPGYGTSPSGYIWIAGKRAVMDYGRKYGRHFKGRNPETRIQIRETEYNEFDGDIDDTPGIVNYARYRGATWDRHEDFDLIQYLKREPLLIRKIIFFNYFLEMTAEEIAEELGKSPTWIHRKIQYFKEDYYKDNFLQDKDKYSSLCLEDFQMQKLEDFYTLVQRQSSTTRK